MCQMDDIVLALDRIRNMVAEVEAMAPGPKEVRVNPLTMVGRYGPQWRMIEESKSNKGPFGPLFRVIEDENVEEGIVILCNLRPRNDALFTVIDLRIQLVP